MIFKTIQNILYRIDLCGLLTILFFPQLSLCQVPFFKTYGDTAKDHYDRGYAVMQTDDDNFDSDIYLIKLDEEGSYQWFSTIGRNLGEIGDETHYRGSDVEETLDGGYIITGAREIWTRFGEYQDLCVVKTNDKGQITDVEEVKTKNPLNFTLLQNYPNPFNPSTTISFSVGT